MDGFTWSIVILFALIVVLCIFWYLAVQFFEIAQSKGFSDRKYLWICFWLGIPGWILVCALPDRKNGNAPMIAEELPEL